MSFNQVVEQYTTYLLKLSYLNVGNRQAAEDIVQEVLIKFYEKFGDNIPLENPKSSLVMMTLNRCRDYFKSWSYRKLHLIEVFSKETSRELSHLGQSELMQAIHKLPIHFREVIILYYFDEQTTTEMAKILGCPISTVKMRLQRAHQLLNIEGTLHAKIIGQALGNWNTESVRVKQEIYRGSKQRQASKAKYKRLKWQLSSIAVLLMLLLGGFYMWQREDEANVPILPIESKPVAPEVEVGQSQIIPHQKTLQLYKYDAFYNNTEFYSETHAELKAIERVMSIYPTLYHMDKYNYSFPKDREEHYRNRSAAIFNSSMKDPSFKKYFELIQQKHGITEQDYIEHYLFVEEKYYYMNNQLHANLVGYVDGAYPNMEVNKEYEAIIGISLDEINGKIKEEANLNLNQNDEVNNPPLKRYMETYPYQYFKFVYNEKGEVIIVPTEFSTDYREVYRWIADNLMGVLYYNIFTYESGLNEQLPMLNRVNLPEYVTLLEQFEGTAEQESFAQEAITFIRILRNSVEVELKNEFFELPHIIFDISSY